MVSWNIEDYPFIGAIGQAGEYGVQSGFVTSVPGNGVAVPVTFATPFGVVPSVVPGPNTLAAASGQMLSVQFYNVTLNGFTVIVYGGTSATLTVDWIASTGS